MAALIVGILILIPLIGFVYMLITQLGMWSKGIIPRHFKFNEDNMAEILILLAALFIKLERRNNKEKASYLKSYLTLHYPNYGNHLNKSFSMAMSATSLKINSTCRWINKHIDDPGYKAQIIYFLTYLAMIDGRLNSKERQALEKMTIALKLPIKEFTSILSGIEEHHRKKAEKKQKENQRYRQASQRTSYSKKKQMAQILEVSENATFEEIKKSYRKMVKLHHPDRFHNNGEEQIKLAQERFVEIQLAYEYFEKVLN